MTNSLAEVLKSAPTNCWLALNRDQTAVVAASEDPERAVQEALAKGELEPILIWAPEAWVPSVL